MLAASASRPRTLQQTAQVNGGTQFPALRRLELRLGDRGSQAHFPFFPKLLGTSLRDASRDAASCSSNLAFTRQVSGSDILSFVSCIAAKAAWIIARPASTRPDTPQHSASTVQFAACRALPPTRTGRQRPAVFDRCFPLKRAPGFCTPPLTNPSTLRSQSKFLAVASRRACSPISRALLNSPRNMTTI